MPGEPRGPNRGAPRSTRGARPAPRTDPDGVRILAGGGIRKRVWLLAGAVALASAALLAAGRLAFEFAGTAEAEEPRAVAAAAEPARAPEVSKLHAVPRAAQPAPPAPQVDEIAPGAPEEPAYTIDSPGSAPSGIALFPPPGTDPPKRGIIVPDDAELPEGYVRHYQATDDGKALPPILMFHPDYEWVDDQGAVVALPENRVVPPEMAPPGLPIQMLEIPEPEDDSRGRP